MRSTASHKLLIHRYLCFRQARECAPWRAPVCPDGCAPGASGPRFDCEKARGLPFGRPRAYESHTPVISRRATGSNKRRLHALDAEPQLLAGDGDITVAGVRVAARAVVAPGVAERDGDREGDPPDERSVNALEVHVVDQVHVATDARATRGDGAGANGDGLAGVHFADDVAQQGAGR